MRGFVASSRFPHNTHTQCARTRRKGYNECPRWMCTAVCVSTLPVIYPLIVVALSPATTDKNITNKSTPYSTYSMLSP